ncbi:MULTISPECIES: dienelactone hydrolase family protein [Bradyrhizobium]|uniref:dienelactone hydrolase family protein n=1 Tax=Bradyrhizobium TaxID=374 RepID=UPI00048785BA|nr:MULTISPECIES: dienelactone hydrolase family protein [Bradyrhizobium]MCS3449052.1 carboxymethylenebutenolidase [Bradyrhizobium elkanii]MCS3559805.1 carboxymethylenebutenolidase [Bradyrhizobium elkanii]MCW2150349.1 carboxymethylenebutenolidase [Bradyrhizobium elkanii]MCW2359593.1 carboxymethylenebutenolidase [Bradyrhizobium elkanii]MCW2374080.1 carboxymethylenebutenolidase [Bradyrhizobium elkanii]
MPQFIRNPAHAAGMTHRAIPIVLLMLTTLPTAAAAAPDTVFLRSADGKTEIVGYLFRPQTPGPHPAIVLLHGRGGPYSINVNRDCTLVSRTNPSAACNAGSLSKRHAMWGQYWADHGYVALLPDSFGPRGKAHGFGRFTHDDPDRTDVNEKTVRPLDAEGALSWLRSQKEINGDRIFLQGWSNGGSTALNVMQRQGAATSGYRAALVFYPGCGPAALLAQTIKSGAPITMLLGSDDEEVSPDRCRDVASRSVAAGSKIDVVVYPGATHDFDDPGRGRQSNPANSAALQDAMVRAIAAIDGLKD